MIEKKIMWFRILNREYLLTNRCIHCKIELRYKLTIVWMKFIRIWFSKIHFPENFSLKSIFKFGCYKFLCWEGGGDRFISWQEATFLNLSWLSWHLISKCHNLVVHFSRSLPRPPPPRAQHPVTSRCLVYCTLYGPPFWAVVCCVPLATLLCDVMLWSVQSAILFCDVLCTVSHLVLWHNGIQCTVCHLVLWRNGGAYSQPYCSVK